MVGSTPASAVATTFSVTSLPHAQRIGLPLRRAVATLARAGLRAQALEQGLALGNARAFLAVQEECGSFDAYVWRFVGRKPKVNRWSTLREIPARTRESDALSKDLLARGFRFVGHTICYAYMQAVGLVNDHTGDCFSHRKLS